MTAEGFFNDLMLESFKKVFFLYQVIHKIPIMLKIGKVKIKSGLILAPLAGISDLPFRRLNREFGAEFAFVEMLNVRSLGGRSPKTKSMLAVHPDDIPLGIQILGKEPRYILPALEIIERYNYDILDFNSACPVKKVVRRGEGAALLEYPRKLAAILKLIVDNSSRPVTVKLRTGINRCQIKVDDLRLIAEESGIQAVFIHGRTREQAYSGQVDYKFIQAVKKSLHIPVIASGDILSPELAKKMLDETGCDGLLVARGALGNPWIFAQIKEYLAKAVIQPRPGAAEVVAVMEKHFQMCLDFYGDKYGMVIFRKFFHWYTKGMRHIRRRRLAADQMKTKQEMAKVFGDLLTPKPQNTQKILTGIGR